MSAQSKPRTEPYRMKDLCRLTGLPRQVIHFYINEGLLPEGKKTGRNMAWYGEEHVERLRTVKRLQVEHFLPLRAIRAMFEAQEHTFSPAQAKMLLALKHELAGSLAPPDIESSDTVVLDELIARIGLDRADVDAMVAQGLLASARDADDREVISSADVWVLENYAKFRQLGFTRELGFLVADNAIYEDAITRLVMFEAERLTKRLAHLPPAQVATMVRGALPLLADFLVRYHAAKIRNLFAALL